MSNISISFENPWLLLLAIPALAIILVPFLLLPAKRRKTAKKTVPVILHTVIVCFLVLILSGFAIVKTSDEQAAIILVDLSDSTSSVHSEISANTQEILDLMDKDTPIGVIAFADNQIYSLELEKDDKTFSAVSVTADATNIGEALEYSATLLPQDKAGRIILLSDGKETDGDADNTAHYLATQGIRIDAVYYDTTALSTDEIQIGSFVSPEGIYVGDEAVFTAEIKSNVDGTALVSLYDGETLIQTKEVSVTSGSTSIQMTDTPSSGGMHSYRIVLSTDTDSLSENNECYAYLKVDGEASVLIISDTVAHASTLENILSAKNAVTVVTAGNAPNSIVELCNYDEVILSNVDYNDLPSGYDSLLEDYVSIYGRSLLAAGGTETFMYGNMSGTALEEILPVTFSLSESSEGNSVALMLVLDCSMSMSQQSTYLSVAKQGAIKCVEAMTDNDYVGVISFNRSAYLNASLVKATESNKNSLTRTISGLTTSQGTYYTEALELAHEELNKSSAAVKHIIFLSDGNPSDYGYTEAVSSASADGITVTTIGLGYSSSILEDMAEAGGGRYYYVSSATDLPDIMLSETEQVTVSSLITGNFVPVINKSSELTDSVTSLPAISGYLGTTIKEKATSYLTTDEGHPIYAAWNYGNGTVACFTSDLYGDWSSGWMSDSAGQTVIKNMVNTTVSDSHHDSSLSVETEIRGKSADITVKTSGATGNAVSVTVSGMEDNKTYVLTQTDTGIYKGNIVLEQPGIYELLITEIDSEGNIVDYVETAVARSYSAEYDAFADSGESLLNNICSYSNGKIFSSISELVSVKVSSVSIIYNPMVLFAILSLLMLLTDIAIRKLRWKDLKNYLIRIKNMG